jgi:hypothetical protein
MMITDVPPRNANRRAGFLESDRIRTLDLPQDECLLTISQSIESAMKSGANVGVRRACAEFLGATSEFYRIPACGVRFWSGGALVVIVTLVGWITLIKSLLFLFLPPEVEAGFFLRQLHYQQLFYLYTGVSLVLGIYLTYGGFKSTSH